MGAAALEDSPKLLRAQHFTITKRSTTKHES
jgi:hypothetical protein